MFYILPTLQVGQPLHNYCGGKRLYHLKYGLFRDTGALGQVRTCDSPLNTAVSTQILLEKTTMQVIKRKQTRSVWGCEPPLPSGLSKVLRRLAMTRMITLPWVTTSPPLMERGAEYRLHSTAVGFSKKSPHLSTDSSAWAVWQGYAWRGLCSRRISSRPLCECCRLPPNDTDGILVFQHGCEFPGFHGG